MNILSPEWAIALYSYWDQEDDIDIFADSRGILIYKDQEIRDWTTTVKYIKVWRTFNWNMLDEEKNIKEENNTNI